MQKQETDWSKYSNESIDFILAQSEKSMNETFVSYRENTNKSYAALAIYSSLLSYCIAKIVTDENVKSYVYLFVLSLGMLSCIIIIFSNLNPKKMSFIGSCKSLLCQDYYENDVNKEEQFKEYKIQTIETYDEAIKDNYKEVVSQIEYFNISVCVFIAVILVTLFAFFIFG